LSLANPIVDITGVTTVLAAYGFAYSPALSLRAPIVAAYFLILAALPVASTVRKAAIVAGLAVTEYVLLLVVFNVSGRMGMVWSPVAANASGAISLLYEAAKVLLLACGGAVATYATYWQDRLSRRVAQAAQDREELQDRLEDARLRALRLQLQPHFLFNTLNTITALVHHDPGSAERMVTGLSELLRASLRQDADHEVRLDQELELARHFLAIQQVRFADRLQVRFDIDPAANAGLVPSLLLQPLVENAVLHGIAPRAAAGCVAVSARRNGNRLAITVSDDGVGVSPGDRPDGVGLGNTRARLATLYGSRHRFEAGPGARGGFTVSIEIPFQVDASTGDRTEATP